MCEFCQGYRQAARDLSNYQHTRAPVATPCPYMTDPNPARAMQWISGYMAYLEASSQLSARLDDPTPQEREKTGQWVNAGIDADSALSATLQAARDGGR